MKISTKLLSSSITGVALAGLIAAPAFACTPKGVITKYVQDKTTGSQMVDANTEASALTVHPGDTLIYTIVVGNNGGPSKNGTDDDMVNTKMTDNLPNGVTPTSGSKAISEDLGTVKEQKTVTKTYTVMVDANAKDGQIINNKACYTGEAINNDKKAAQAGCDVAIVKVSVPPTSTPPVTPPTTTTPPVTPPAVLPSTGVGNLIVPAGVATGLGYVGNMLRLKRRASQRG